MLRETEIKYGKLKGIPGNDPRVTAYKGIPFAAPPTGANRWCAPIPCDKWDGVKEAYTFGPISMQDQPAVGDDLYAREWHVDKDIPMSEDCLYLNIWTPAKSRDEKLAVLVWYFGGAFQWGYTAEMEFNGERLARRGIIVVTVNYRLQTFGFLAHPDLTAQQPDSPSNFGLLDQQAGLKWVYNNIEAFGGDPDNITIAGQSAGGGSVLNQICNPENYGMIKAAAIFSGFIRMDGSDKDIFIPLELKEAEQTGVEILKYLGVSSIEDARKLDAFYIRDKYAEYVKDHPRIAPSKDNVHYTCDPYLKFREGKSTDIPILTGYTTDEFIFGGINMVKKSVTDAISSSMKSGKKAANYVYEFGANMPGHDNPGVFHSSDLWFWFETLNMCWRPFSGAHFELAREMCDCFANFVKYHDPNGPEKDPSDPSFWNAAGKDSLNVKKFYCG